ncbi:MAG: hypothetical protein WCC17_15620 [Candidatus Nitrosopolaris sp.]
MLTVRRKKFFNRILKGKQLSDNTGGTSASSRTKTDDKETAGILRNVHLCPKN